MDNILLLNGSTRKNSTSQSMIYYMQEQIKSKGQKVSSAALIDVFDQKISIQELLTEIKKAETIGVIACCYINTLSYPTIECLEKLAELGRKELEGKNLFAIGHGGMPYLDVHESCLLVCQCFAEQMQMKWLGGAIRGLTPVINGKKLDKDIFLGKDMMNGLDLLTEDIMGKRSISPKVQKYFNIYLPKIINYPLAMILNYVGNKDRKAHGITDFDRKVYEEKKLS